MKLTETPNTMISEDAPPSSETGRKYWDAYDIAQRSDPSWKTVLAFFGVRFDRN
ncbi:hypothetical protein [Gymnodinialimonas sp.]